MSVDSLKKHIQHNTDTDILKEVLSGNVAMFEILIRRYNPYLYKVGRSYGFNHQDTEDLMQETFINSYISLKQFTERASFKTWLIKIMLNQCYRKAHKYSYLKEQAADIVSDKSSYMFLPGNHSDNDNAVTNRELKNVIEACLQKLPQNFRTTFVLRELTGLSVEETAELMHISAANVKVRLNRAKALLRKEIEKVYTPEDIYEFNLIYCNRMVDAVMKKIKACGDLYPDI
jgi:RNA polymerase sigma factor (sigma-70 family)